MSGRTNRILYLIIIGIALILSLSGCKNPLVSLIDDEVAVAITPPEVLSNFPEKSADDVPINLATITVTLTKYIDPSSVSSSTFYVADSSGNLISGSRNVENESITFSPNSSLQVGTVYTVTLDGIKDLDGNFISEKYTWSFTTGIEGDTVRPTISSMTVNGGEEWTNGRTVSIVVDATDNFGIAQMNISTTGSFSDADWVPWQETFNLDLPGGDGIKHIYLKLKDGSGLETANYTSAAIGFDTTIPEVALFSLDGGNSGTRNSSVSVDILGVDETGGSGIADYRIHTEGASWGTWAALDEGSILLENQPLSVSSDETEVFYLQVRDNAGNISDVETQSITYDFTAPSVDNSLSNPIPGSTDNRIKSYIKVVFTEEMDTTTINSSTVYVTKGTEKISTSVYEYIDNKTGIEFTEFELGGQPYILQQNTGYNVFIGGSVADVAGNTIGSDFTYTFANDSFIDNTPPEGQIVLDINNPGSNATPTDTFDLMIKASDDYNGVRAVKIWGDNGGGGYPTFESDAAWKLYSEDDVAGSIDYMSYDTAYSPASGGWDLPVSDGDYYIYYKFVDFANNETAVPGRLKVSLDTTDPVLNGIQVNDGSGYSKNTNDTVNIIIDAEDGQSGLYEMWVSQDANDALSFPASNSGSWQSWSSAVTSYHLGSGEGKYFIYGEAKDFVGNLSTLNGKYATVILDYTKPVVSFSQTDFLETNSLAQQTVTIADYHSEYDPDDPNALDGTYKVSSDIASYLWEQESGPGTLSFYSDSAGTVPDSTVNQPWVSAGASDGSQDGTYEIKVTAADNAGNSAYNIVDFIWDTVDPADLGTLTAYNQDGSQLTTSANASMVYTPSARPYVTWAVPTGADFFVMIPSSELISPNDDPGVQYAEGAGYPDNGWYPHWDDDEVDWSVPGTYESKNYIKSESPVISAPAPDSPGQNDGEIYIYATAWDNAGNRSNRSTDKLVRFWIDTMSPVVTNLQDLSPMKSAYEINYRTSDNTGDGRVYDQKTADDPFDTGDRGSGIQSYMWTQNDGPYTDALNIQDANTLTPIISAAGGGTVDGEYELKLTATDKAGNVGEGYLTFIWDTTAPASPSVSGITHTPNVAPTWSWNGTGGGNGTYRYRLDRIGRYWWNSNGGAYYGSSENVVDWTETTELDFDPSDSDYPGFPTSSLDDQYEYTLYVQERDVAGNWSASGSRAIWVDTHYTSEPALNLEGAYLRNSYGTNRQVTWNWSTGLGNPATERYRYRLLDSASGVVTDWTVLADDVTSLMIDFATYDGGNPLDDDVYTFEVEEENIGTGWVGKIASSNVQIDATAPIKPEMYDYTTGYNVSNNGYYLSNDTTPYFRWSSGGGGNGSYRWSFDESSWTYTSSIYVTTSNSQGVYTFYVQERDTAGNWSDSATWNLEIDTTAPTLSSILLKNRSTNAYNTTSYTVSTIIDIDVSGSGSNLQTYTGSDIKYMRFWNSGGSTYTYTYSPTKSAWYFSYGGGDTSDGYKYVYCELIDYAGNVSVTRSDGITLDATAPPVTSFNINSGATTTTSSSVTLYSSYSDANYMRFSTDGGANWSGWYTPSTSKAWTLNTSNGYNGYGAKKVMVQFTDYAGYYSRNTVTGVPASYTQKEDSIFYGSPVMRGSYKGYTNNGYIRTYYESFPSDTGSANTFHVYYASSPTGTKYEKGTTTSNTYFGGYDYAVGTPYYLFVQVYNPDIGYSNYSGYSLGFSSDIAIIYDDDDTDDTSLAGTIKSWIQRDWTSQYSTYHMQGSYTWSEYSVTLVPEDEVQTIYYESGNDTYDRSIIYGDPTIITPSAANLYANTNRAKNIVKSNHGIIAMHYYGWRFLQTVANNWASFGMSGTAPTDLDYAYSKGETQYANIKPYYSQYDYIWHKYMYYDTLWTSYKYTEDYDNLMFTTSTTGSTGIADRWSIYSTNSSGTNGTYFYADDPDYANYYTVARQGEFCYWAYDKLPAYVNGGIPFFYNVVRQMSLY